MKYREIPLSNGGAAKVDAEDYDNLAQRKWHRNADGYAVTDMRLDGKRIFLSIHRVVMRAPKGVEVDHINRDRLDCRKANLRFCTRRENVRNKGQFAGCAVRAKGRWLARINVDGKPRHIGSFQTEAEAVEAARGAEADLIVKEREEMARLLAENKTHSYDLSHHHTKPPQTKLTERQVLEVRYLRLVAGTGTKEIAEKYGVTVSTIKRIVNGQRWPELPTDAASITSALNAIPGSGT